MEDVAVKPVQPVGWSVWICCFWPSHCFFCPFTSEWQVNVGTQRFSCCFVTPHLCFLFLPKYADKQLWAIVKKMTNIFQMGWHHQLGDRFSRLICWHWLRVNTVFWDLFGKRCCFCYFWRCVDDAKWGGCLVWPPFLLRKMGRYQRHPETCFKQCCRTVVACKVGEHFPLTCFPANPPPPGPPSEVQ